MSPIVEINDLKNWPVNGYLRCFLTTPTQVPGQKALTAQMKLIFSKSCFARESLWI